MSLPTIEMLSMRMETLEKQIALLLNEQKVVSKEKKEKKSQHESSSHDEEEPKTKHGPNGYILFAEANRNDVKQKLHVGDEKPKNTEIMKELANMWQSLDATEKARWNDKAKEANLGRGRKTKHI